jgi:hypothetical protein
MATPIPYNLDILGGLQFEQLVQLLLLAELGLGVESWGGSADHGKDAYCESELNFPNRRVTNPGPFIFQAKFISGANAAGARFEKDLLGAVAKEVELIENRLKIKKWKIPQHYGFFTNAPITARQREKVRERLQAALPKTKITIQGALGICNLLDLNISVARAFPQILSLRDLTDLLRTVVRNSSIQRSEGVIKESEALTKVFVPTRAYERAWQVLLKHNFVVLEGPPEMGKTAIAWMIAAVQLTQKWEAIDCDGPDDLFEAYSSSKKQLFVADDAFGTTEYETTRGSNWGRNLHKILPKLNSTHRLVLTSRMHILKKALQEMSLQGRAATFPKPAEVIVNASRIDRKERALILYRHARAAGLEEAAKNIVRNNAEEVIENSHFTPERIKRFVGERLPDLMRRLADGDISESDIPNEIDEAIERPTDRMEKTFSKLNSNQKWLLIALLDCERGPSLEELESAYRRFSEIQRPIAEEVQLLEEGFLQSNPGIDWIHPSYRDLVINELEKDETAANHFLEHCALPGIYLAVSVAGGAAGKRQFPLMSGPKSWDILQGRMLQLIRQSTPVEISSLLSILSTAILSAEDVPDILGRLSGMLTECCSEAKVRLDKLNQAIPSFILKGIFDSTMRLNPPAPMPSLYESLKYAENIFSATVEKSEKEKTLLDSSLVMNWAETLVIVANSDRRLLIQSDFPAEYAAKIARLCSLVENEIRSNPPLVSEDAFPAEITRLMELSNALRDLVGIVPNKDRSLRRASKMAEKRASTLQSKYNKILEDDDDSDFESRNNEEFDLVRLFADL